MKPVYEREDLTITEFDIEDVITTSGEGGSGAEPDTPEFEHENAYRQYNSLRKTPGSWF